MKYEIELTKPAKKAYLKLPEEIRKVIYNKLITLAESPSAKNNNVTCLQGIKNCFRLRVGKWRVIYRLYNNSLTIEVIKIAHRREVYR